MTRRPQCTAISRSRHARCRMTAQPGYDVCLKHGGEPTVAHPPTAPAPNPFDNQAAMHRELAVPADTPRDERYVTLRSIRVAASNAYVVAVVDGRNVVTDWRSTYLTPSLPKARNAANRLFQRTTKEN